MQRLARFLLTASALVPVAAHAAAAEENPAPVIDAGEAATIVVVGRGEVRQAQTLSARDLAVLAPAASPLKAIENLPSVNFQSADPAGAYEWAERVSIRGFNQNQLASRLMACRWAMPPTATSTGCTSAARSSPTTSVPPA
jgi:iron complex outermembrane receptor protein